jgi:hypothetical protein
MPHKSGMLMFKVFARSTINNVTVHAPRGGHVLLNFTN